MAQEQRALTLGAERNYVDVVSHIGARFSRKPPTSMNPTFVRTQRRLQRKSSVTPAFERLGTETLVAILVKDKTAKMCQNIIPNQDQAGCRPEEESAPR